MKNGRPPKPLQLHRLHGTYHATKHRDRADLPAPGDLEEPPVWLSPKQRRRFRELVEQAPRRLLRQADRAMLASFVVIEGHVAEANRLQQKGLGKEDAHLSRLCRFLPLLRQFASELGLSPSGRASVRLPAGESEDGHYGVWLRRWSEIQEAARPTPAQLEARRQRMEAYEAGQRVDEEVSDADEASEVQTSPPEEQASEPGGVEPVPPGVPPEAERDGEGLRRELEGIAGEMAPGES
jgi:phage terminase small subunit